MYLSLHLVRYIMKIIHMQCPLTLNINVTDFVQRACNLTMDNSPKENIVLHGGLSSPHLA